MKKFLSTFLLMLTATMPGIVTPTQVHAAGSSEVCTLNLQENVHDCDSDLISFTNGYSGIRDNKTVLKINMKDVKRASFHGEYTGEPTGWTINIGDSATNNGYAGDSNTQSNDAELEVVNQALNIHGNDNTPATSTQNNHRRIVREEKIVEKGSTLNLYAYNQEFGWASSFANKGMWSPYFLALDGQEDTQGSVNYDIFVGLNRAISGSRTGSGLGKMRITLDKKAPQVVELPSPQPDLTIEDIKYYEQRGNGKNVLTAKICNRGNAEAKGGSNDYLGVQFSEKISGKTKVENWHQYDFQPGQCQEIPTTYSVETLGVKGTGDYLFTAYVDPKDDVEELNESNNVYSETVHVSLEDNTPDPNPPVELPDLTVSHLNLDVDLKALKPQICNFGNADLRKDQPFYLRFKADNGRSVAKRVADTSMAPGSCAVFTATIVKLYELGLNDGGHNITVYIDDKNDVKEKNEHNNVFGKGFVLDFDHVAGPDPVEVQPVDHLTEYDREVDFAIERVEIMPRNPKVGDFVKARFWIKNVSNRRYTGENPEVFYELFNGDHLNHGKVQFPSVFPAKSTRFAETKFQIHHAGNITMHANLKLESDPNERNNVIRKNIRVRPARQNFWRPEPRPVHPQPDPVMDDDFDDSFLDDILGLLGGFGDDHEDDADHVSTQDYPDTEDEVMESDSFFEDEVVTSDAGFLFPDTRAGTLEATAASYLRNKAIIGGFPDGEFKGSQDVNRAEASKFLLLAKGVDPTTYQDFGQFPDVKRGEWYVKYVLKAAQLGIVNGHPSGLFKPADTVNTAEFLKMMNETFILPKNMVHNYRDVAADAWYDQYAGVAFHYNLFPSRNSYYLEPGRELTREEVAIAIYQFLTQRDNLK